MNREDSEEIEGISPPKEPKHREALIQEEVDLIKLISGVSEELCDQLISIQRKIEKL